MPLSGVLGADFASFFDACQKAEVSLTSFESGGAKVEKQLNRVSDAFSGKRVIQEATLMAEVFDRAGGAATFTSGELLRMGNSAHEARTKLVALGQEVPPGLQRLSDATQNAANAARGAETSHQGLTTSLRAFDGVLQGLGVNIGPQAKLVEDLASAAGKTATELGGVAVSGLAVGAAIGGWEIGRAASEFFDLDEKIGDATAALLGFGDVAGEKAAAKADVLARASKYAGFEVKEMGLALMLNAQAATEAIKANVELSDNLIRMKGPEESAKQLANWRGELDAVRASGALPGLTADLQSQNFSMTELAKRYVLSAEALSLYAREVAAIDKVHEKNAQQLAKLADQWKATEDKIAENHARALESIAKYEADFDNQRVQQQGTATEQEISEIKTRERELIASLERRGQANEENLARVHADTKQALDEVGVEWDQVRDRSISSLRDTADRALETYNAMVASGNFYREDLDKQLAKYRELRDASTAMGHAAIDAQDDAAAAAKKHTDELEKQLALNDALIRSRTSTFEVTASNLGQAIAETSAGPGSFRGLGAGYAPQAFALAEEGYSFQEIVAILRGGPKYKPIGPRIPGFEGGVEDFGGGLAMVGERGPELLNLPRGSGVIPLDAGAGRPVSVTVHQYISGVFDPATARRLADLTSHEVLTRITMAGLVRT